MICYFSGSMNGEEFNQKKQKWRERLPASQIKSKHLFTPNGKNGANGKGGKHGAYCTPSRIATRRGANLTKSNLQPR